MNKHELIQTVNAAQHGDKKAFEQLYAAYRDRIWFFVNKNTGSDALSEDIVSETFLTAMQKIGELRQAESFGSWLYTIAYNECRRQMSIEGKSVQLDSDDEKQQLIENALLNEPMLLPEDHAVNAETKKRLEEIIDSLSPDQRSAVILYYYNELTVPEVARALGTNENNTRQKLFKARRRIKKQIEKLLGTGAMLSAVPLGAVLENMTDAGCIAFGKGSAQVAGTSLLSKLTAAAAVAAVAAGVPTAAMLAGEKPDDLRFEPIYEQIGETEAAAVRTVLARPYLTVSKYGGPAFPDGHSLLYPRKTNVDLEDIRLEDLLIYINNGLYADNSLYADVSLTFDDNAPADFILADSKAFRRDGRLCPDITITAKDRDSISGGSEMEIDLSQLPWDCKQIDLRFDYKQPDGGTKQSIILRIETDAM